MDWLTFDKLFVRMIVQMVFFDDVILPWTYAGN